MELITMLSKLTETPGVSGSEKLAADAAADLLRPFCDTVTVSKRGSVIGRMGNDGPCVMLDAHLDQIGLIVTDYAENGFLKFDKCGGVDARILAGQEVTVLGKSPVYGIVSSVPPHLRKSDDAGKVPAFSEMAIDTGLSDEHLKELVSRGDRVVFKSVFSKLLNDEVTAGALDDRAGAAALIRTAELLHEKNFRGNVMFSLSVQEEVGGRGAASAAFSEDICAAAAVDVSFARTPGCRPDETGKIGCGPMIGVSPLLSRSVSSEMVECAEANDIPYQWEVMNGRTGTHADELAVQGGGTPVTTVSIPIKYMHTPAEAANLKDIENTAQLLCAWIMSRGGDEE